jgi:type I restriction enzyme, S subunit
MGDEWKIVTWGELITLEYGKGLKNYKEKKNLYPVYGTNGQIGWHSEALCNSPGVIVGRKGAYRGVHFSKSPFYVIDTAFFVKPKVDIDIKWIYYALLTYDINSMDSGSAIPSTSRDSFYKLTVKLPTKKEQKKIAHILSILDDKIELNRKMNETLEAIAQALFQSWFVDFDPVIDKALAAGNPIPEPLQGRAEARQALGDLRKPLPQNIAQHFPDDFEETELGWIPRCWESKLLGDILSPKKGKTITKKICINGNIPVIAGGLKPAYFHNQSNVTSPVVTISASGANAGYVNLHFQNIWASDCSYIGHEQTSTLYLWYIFLKFNQERIFEMQHGAAQPHIYPSDIMRLPIIYPNNHTVWQQANELLTPSFLKIGELLSSSETLINLRNTLLPKLISGEIRIPDAEKLVAEVT